MIVELLAFAGVMLGAYWWSLDHGDDGVEITCVRLVDKLAWAAKIDPGVALAQREVTP